METLNAGKTGVKLAISWAGSVTAYLTPTEQLLGAYETVFDPEPRE